MLSYSRVAYGWSLEDLLFDNANKLDEIKLDCGGNRILLIDSKKNDILLPRYAQLSAIRNIEILEYQIKFQVTYKETREEWQIDRIRGDFSFEYYEGGNFKSIITGKCLPFKKQF